METESAKSQVSPTVRDVMVFLGLKNTRGPERHLRALAEKGYLQHFPKTSRAYRIPIAASWPNELMDSRESTARHSENRRIPVIGRAPGGKPSAQELEELGEVCLPIRVSENAFAVRVVGNSMRDAHIIDGDVVVVDPAQEPLDRSIVLAEIDHEYTVKVLRKTPSAWWLEPANEDFAPVIPRIVNDRVVAPIVALYRPKLGRRERTAEW